jgi:hypothetical protein
MSDAVRKWSQYQTIYKKSNMVASWYNGYGMLDMPPEIPLSVRYEDFKERLSEAFNRLKVEDKPDSV